MSKPGVDELLIRCVLDHALLQRLRNAPESVFREYELTEEMQEVLAHPDKRLIWLLGMVVQEQARDNPAAHSDTTHTVEASLDEPATSQVVSRPSGDTPPVVPLAASRIALRLVPYVQQHPEASETASQRSQVTVTYAAHLDQLPAGTALEDLPDVPQVAAPGQPVQPLGFVVTVQPMVWADTAGNQQITFSVAASLQQNAATAHMTGAPATSAPATLSPWCHDVDSPRVRLAAARVHDCAEHERYDRLLDLIKVMVAEEPAGETER